MAQIWPATVPTDFLLGGFSESPADNLIRSGMGAGPDKVRRRSTAGVRPIVGDILMTVTQLATFDTFYVTTLASGALTFNLAHPRTSVSQEMRFTTPPTYKPNGGVYWRVSVSMEILP